MYNFRSSTNKFPKIFLKNFSELFYSPGKAIFRKKKET